MEVGRVLRALRQYRLQALACLKDRHRDQQADLKTVEKPDAPQQRQGGLGVDRFGKTRVARRDLQRVVGEVQIETCVPLQMLRDAAAIDVEEVGRPRGGAESLKLDIGQIQVLRLGWRGKDSDAQRRKNRQKYGRMPQTRQKVKDGFGHGDVLILYCNTNN